MPRITRREFVRGSAAAAALGPAAAAAPAAGRRRVGPNDEVRVAVVGVRGRGGDHVNGFRGLEGVRVVGLCDVDEGALAGRAAALEQDGQPVFTCTDMRRLLDRDDVDAISIATPNHWHALATVWACQAGKDVYVEKPISHDPWEGRQMVAAAERYGRVVQTGTQSRSSQGIADAIAWLQAGNLGRAKVARGFCYKARRSIGRVAGPQPLPAGVDYDLWTGPAPLVPLRRRSLHYDWHWVFDTGNGDLGNQGVHQMDLCRWALGVDGVAPRAMGFGGRFGYVDDANTPNTQVVVHSWPEASLVFEVRGLPVDAETQRTSWDNDHMDRYKGVSIGCVIECEDGWLQLPDYSSARAYDLQGQLVQEWRGASSHYANFVAAMRSRRAADLNASVRDGHLSAALCHVGNASYRLGTRCAPAEARERIGDDALAAEAFERMSAHLAANGVDLARDPVAVGPWLELDPETERCTNREEANWLLTRQYRAPFVVPAVV